MDHILCVCSSAPGHLGHCHPLATVNDSALSQEGE